MHNRGGQDSALFDREDDYFDVTKPKSPSKKVPPIRLMRHFPIGRAQGRPESVPGALWREQVVDGFAEVVVRWRPGSYLEAMMKNLLLLAVLILLPRAGELGAQESDPIWTALAAGGHIAIMRHAVAPGTGDPPNFTLGDCTTQRNLSDGGRRQAVATGEAFRRRGVAVGRVLTSRWCRCRETAELLKLGPVEPYPVLDSFFGSRERGPGQTAALRAFVGESFDGPSMVLVTHQVNITALTDVFPASGEIVVIKPLGDGNFRVLGSIAALR
jgi:phosphohistidine phosphatase SixA